MADTVLTIEQILEKLNEGKATKPWTVIPGIFSLQGSKIENKQSVSKAEVLILKSFINQETGEVKSYLSKLTDEPETKDLPI